jgi:hypothetical protein
MTLSPFRDFAVLPKDFRPAFPEKCVRCAAPKPAGRVTLWTMSTSWWAWILPIVMLFSKLTRVTFPACRGCAWRIRFRRLFSVALTLALMVAALGLVYPWTQGWPKLFRRLTVGGAALVALIPWAFWEVWFPPAVTLTLESETIRYDFREIEFAAEFRLLNRAALLE